MCGQFEVQEWFERLRGGRGFVLTEYEPVGSHADLIQVPGHWMALPRQCQGIATALPRHCHGIAVVLPWLCHGIAMALPGHCHGIAVGRPHHCHGMAMAIPMSQTQIRSPWLPTGSCSVRTKPRLPRSFSDHSWTSNRHKNI